MPGRQRDGAGFGRTRQLLENAFEPVRASESSDVGLPAAREALVALRRRRDVGALADAREHAPPRGEQFVSLRNGYQRTIERSRQIPHCRKALARVHALGLDGLDDLIGQLNVERARILCFEPERLDELGRRLRRWPRDLLPRL